MMRRIVIFSLLACVLFLCGCETSKGMAVGVSSGIANTVSGTATGVAKDSATFAGGVMKLDDWIKRNLW